MWRIAAHGASAETTLLAAGHGRGMQGYKSGVEDHRDRVQDDGGVQDHGSGVWSCQSGVRPHERLHLNSMTPSCIEGF